MRLERLFGVKSLDGFGAFSRAQVAAMGAAIAYVDLTQRGRLPMVKPPVAEASGGVMRIDAATRRNLELTRAMAGGRDGSLLGAVDRTVTAAGARLLETRLASPSTDRGEIGARLDAVQALVEDGRLRVDLRDALRQAPEMERALSRLALGRGGPRDLGAIRDGLAQAARIAGRLAGRGAAGAAGAGGWAAGGSGGVAGDAGGLACRGAAVPDPRRRGRSRAGRTMIWTRRGSFGTRAAGSSPACRASTPIWPASRA